jgi:hypothetical protein
MLDPKIIIGRTRPGRAADRVIPGSPRRPGSTAASASNIRIPFVGEAFGDDGQPKDHRTSAAVKILLDDLAWWAAALQQARARGTLPPAIMRLMGAQEGTGK